MNKQKIIEKQEELIRTQNITISYFRKFAGDSLRITRFMDAIKQLESDLASLKAQEESKSAKEFVKNKLNEKTGAKITLYEHYLAHDTTISIGTAVSWINEFAQSHQVEMPSDAEIDREWLRVRDNYEQLSAETVFRITCEWFESQLK